MKKRKEAIDDLAIIESSGNVFADLNLPDAADLLLKADLSIKIAQIIKSKKLSQGSASKIVGLQQPKLSGLLRGQTNGLSINKLVTVLDALGTTAKIHVDYKVKRAKAASVRAAV